MFTHWNGATRKGRMIPLPTLDPAITQSVLLNTYSAANHDINSIAGGRHSTYNDFQLDMALIYRTRNVKLCARARHLKQIPRIEGEKKTTVE